MQPQPTDNDGFDAGESETPAEIPAEIPADIPAAIPASDLTDELVKDDINAFIAETPPAVKSGGRGKVFSPLVAILTVFSKFIGMARDIVVAGAFGAGMVSDAYNYAYMVTGGVLVLFGGLGGPFHQSSVSVLSSRKQSQDIGNLAGQLLLWTGTIMSVFAVALWFFAPLAPPLVQTVAGWFGSHGAMHQDLWATTIVQLRIMTPMIVVAGLVGVGCGISNTFKEYFWPSMAPAVASVAIIIAVLFFKDEAGLCLGVGTLIGAIGQFIVQWPGIMRAKPNFLQPQFLTKLQPEMKEYLAMLWPAFITTGIGQLNVYVDMIFASRLEEGGWTAIVNANKLVQLPLGVLLTAMVVPLLPHFTELAAAKQTDDLKAELRRALTLIWFLALPLSAVLITLPSPIVQLLFERGQFDLRAVGLFTLVLSYLVPSIFFYVARDLLTRVFIAYQDTKTPYKIAMCSIFVKALCDWLLVVVFPLGIGGIALSTSIVTVFNLSLLSFLLRKKMGNLGGLTLVKPVAVMLSASAACAAVTYFVFHAADPLAQKLFAELPGVLNHHSKTIRLFITIGLASGLGMIAYLIVCQLCKLEEAGIVARKFSSRLGKK